MGARVVLITEEAVKPVIAAGCLAAGLRVYDLEFLKATPILGNVGAVAIEGFTTDSGAASGMAQQVLDDLQPTAVIATEKAGRNTEGVYHTALGNDFSEVNIKVDYLVDEARKRGIFTVGIIDVGNEIGSGNIIETVRDLLPWGRNCKCPCQGGIASVVETDSLIVTAACNFGAYGLCGALAAAADRPSLAWDPSIERLVMQESVRAGARDAVTLTSGNLGSLNGLPIDDYLPLIALLQTVVKARKMDFDMGLLRP